MILAIGAVSGACASDPFAATSEGADGTEGAGDCDSAGLPESVTLGGITMSAGDLNGCAIRHAVIQYPEANGLRVAAHGAGAMLVSNTTTSARLFHIGPDGFEIEALPQEFIDSQILLSQSDAGEVAYVVGERGVSLQHGPHYFVRDGAEWAAQHAIAGPMRLEDFELDAAGNPRIWSFDAATHELQRLARDGSGAWLLEPVANAGRQDRYNLAINDDELHYYYEVAGSSHYQLAVDDNGSLSAMSEPTQYQNRYWTVPPPRPASGASGPRALVVQHGTSGLRLLGSGGVAVTIPGSSPAKPTCSEPATKCSETTCHETGGGMMYERFGVTRAADGSVWIGWETETYDHWIKYGTSCDEPGGTGCHCVKNGTFDDNDHHEFHLARVVDGEVEEVLTIETSFVHRATALRDIDLRAYADRLAVGVRTRQDGDIVLHLLDIDLSRLPLGD